MKSRWTKKVVDTMSYFLTSFACSLFVWLATTSMVVAGDVVIRIVGPGVSANYLGPNQTSSQPVEVNLGDRITWQNEGNRVHTATAFDASGALLFDTGNISPPSATIPVSKSSSIEVTRAMFKQAGGQTGQSVAINYYCNLHGSMEAKLIVTDLTLGAPAEVSLAKDTGLQASGPAATRVRRNITSLNSAELRDYRDAWRRMQLSGEFQRVAGYHGCPNNFCHGDGSIFLPWHREYLLRLENALGGPVHYWDWTASNATVMGIPPAFQATTYVSADGNAYPNPLFASRFRCPANTSLQSTSRRSRSPSLLASYANGVRAAYGIRNYMGFNSSLDTGPHGSVHVWVGGNMGGVATAAYDPVFWAHHANVDRQWASWQASGGPNPPNNILSKLLPGFSPRTAANVVNLAGLGYSYDRLDSVMGTVSPVQVESVATVGNDKGVGRTFSVLSPSQNANLEGIKPMDATKSQTPIQLLVSGLDSHPKQSIFVYVFANQPNATIEDAVPENAHFLGTFGVFGGANQASAHQEEMERHVLSLSPSFESRMGQNVKEVTLVVVDENDVVLSHEQIPIESVRFKELKASPEDGDRGLQPSLVGLNDHSADGWKAFEGFSDRESYDEAYRNAADQAYFELTARGADRMIETKVISVEGSRGGIAGLRSIRVKIQARLK